MVSALKCPDGWDRHENFCYLLAKEKKIWEDASMQCKTFGGNMASIQDQEENLFLQGEFL